jgi:hypothetical protein
MPRFVLLYHDCPPNYARPSHWDFMLEEGDTLRTWALEKLPREWHEVQSLTSKTYSRCLAVADGNKVAAEELGAHRRDYLEYEGEVSDRRGRVLRIGSGTYRTDSETPDQWRLTLVGANLSGKVALNRSTEIRTRWELTCQPAD